MSKPDPEPRLAADHDDNGQCITCNRSAQSHSDYCIWCEMHYSEDDETADEPGTNK